MNGSTRVWLFLLFAALFVFSSSGHLAGNDEETVFQVTKSLVERGDVSVDYWSVVVPAQSHADFLPTKDYGVETTTPSVGRDGRLYSPYGIGQSLAAAPLYLLGRGVAGLWPALGTDVLTRMVVQMLNALWLAATAVLLVESGLALGFGWRIALALAGAFALSTMAWPYAKTWYADPGTAFWLLLAAFALRRMASDDRGERWAFWAGAAFGVAVAFRVTALIAALPLAGYAVWSLVAERGRLRWTRALAWGAVGLAPGVALVVGYNLVRFGRIFAIGYSDTRIGWDTPFVYGLYGLLFSPGKSLFVYSPVLLLALGGLLVWFRTRPREALLAGGMVAMYVAFHAPYTFWTGGWNWGPRFLLPAVPFLILAVGPILQQSKTGLARWVFGLLALAGLVIQLPAVLVDHSRSMVEASERFDRFYDLTIQQPEMSPVVTQWSSAADVLSAYRRPETWEAARDVIRQMGRGGEALTDGERSARSVVETNLLRANVPAFWWVQLYVRGVPPVIAVALVVLNLAVMLLSAVMVFAAGRKPVEVPAPSSANSTGSL